MPVSGPNRNAYLLATVQIQVPWLTMYDEGYVYRRGNSPGDSLLTSYPRVCGFSPLPKFLYQSEFLETPSTNPHYGPPCPQGSNRTTVTASGSAKHPFLVHYYSKSLEDFVIKKEQSLPPYYRSFRERISFCPLGLKAFPYDDLYVELVEKIMAIPFVAAEVENFGGGGLVSGPASAVNLTREEVGPANDYELYQFVKEQLKNGCNFDKECYLKRNPRAREAVSTGVSLDALQYFLSKNFTMTENSNECWGACKTRAS